MTKLPQLLMCCRIHLWFMESWFLSIFSPFLLYQQYKIDTLQVVAIEYNIIVAFYPNFLVALVYKWHDRGCVVLVYAWRRFSCFKKDLAVKGISPQCFITFLTLSSAKLLTLSVTFIVYIEVKDRAKMNRRGFKDGTIMVQEIIAPLVGCMLFLASFS